MGEKPEEALIGFINRRAMEIVSKPANERSAHYDVIRQSMFDSWMKLGMTEAKAKEATDKIEEFIRAAVQIIETTGGSQTTKAQ